MFLSLFFFFFFFFINYFLCLLYYVKLLATVVEGDSKAPFSIATTSRCRGGHNSFLWIASLYPWDWTQVSRAIGKYSKHYANARFIIM